jgi:hypothetical protein
MGVFFKSVPVGPAGEVEERVDKTAVVWSAILLIAFAVFVLVAENAGTMPIATDNLWAAFQTILGVVVGFLGGEAHGRASTSTKGRFASAPRVAWL